VPEMARSAGAAAPARDSTPTSEIRPGKSYLRRVAPGVGKRDANQGANGDSVAWLES